MYAPPMTEASHRERVILALLDSLTAIGFALEDVYFEYDHDRGRWTCHDAGSRRVFSFNAEHPEARSWEEDYGELDELVGQ